MSDREQDKRVKQLAAFMADFEHSVVSRFHWYFTTYGEIRGWAPWFDDEVCPLRAFGLVYEEWDRDAHVVAERCGLSEVSYQIVDASDHWSDEPLRISLEQATGYFRGKKR